MFARNRFIINAHFFSIMNLRGNAKKKKRGRNPKGRSRIKVHFPTDTNHGTFSLLIVLLRR
jgi:hypothetical protein